MNRPATWRSVPGLWQHSERPITAADAEELIKANQPLGPKDGSSDDDDANTGEDAQIGRSSGRFEWPEHICVAS